MTKAINRREILTGIVALGTTLALPACQASEQKMDADIIILGAGLSGLHAARILAAEGKDVLVLEGSNRIGGRLHTLDHGIDGYTEGGGEEIGASYARLIDTANQLGVNLIADTPTQRKTSYFYKETLYNPEAWKTLDTHPFASSSFKGMSPGSPLFRLAAKINPLTSPEEWRNPKFAAFDISAEDFLKDHNLGNEARNIIDIALNGNDLSSYSMINLYRSLQLYTQSRGMGASVSVEGGAQRLPEAMANSLPRKVAKEEVINSITTSENSVTVTTSSGKTFRAAHCICSLPFKALSRVKMSAPLLPLQRKAIENLPYTQIYQLHLKTETPYWEKDGLPADMWTDTSLERIFANRDTSGVPNGLLRVWVNGTGTQIWEQKEDVLTFVKAELKRVRPASEGDCKLLSIQNWTHSNPLAGGAYMHWAPGQISNWAEIMGQPAGRLLFAGEHLSHLHTGMEGAMESGENAAFSLLDA